MPITPAEAKVFVKHRSKKAFDEKVKKICDSIDFCIKKYWEPDGHKWSKGWTVCAELDVMDAVATVYRNNGWRAKYETHTDLGAKYWLFFVKEET